MRAGHLDQLRHAVLIQLRIGKDDLLLHLLAVVFSGNFFEQRDHLGAAALADPEDGLLANRRVGILQGDVFELLRGPRVVELRKGEDDFLSELLAARAIVEIEQGVEGAFVAHLPEGIERGELHVGISLFLHRLNDGHVLAFAVAGQASGQPHHVAPGVVGILAPGMVFDEVLVTVEGVFVGAAHFFLDVAPPELGVVGPVAAGELIHKISQRVGGLVPFFVEHQLIGSLIRLGGAVLCPGRAGQDQGQQHRHQGEPAGMDRLTPSLRAHGRYTSI